MIISPNNMMAFDSIEPVFEFSYCHAVSIHLLVGAIPILIELIGYECGVAVHLEAFNAELNSYTETMKCRLIFNGIIGCSKVYTEDIAKLIP